MRRATAASSGKIPTTSLRRLISLLRRSSGFVLCSLARCRAGLGWEVHVGENVGFGIVLGEGGTDPGGTMRRWVLPA